MKCSRYCQKNLIGFVSRLSESNMPNVFTSMPNQVQETYKIRPAGRHILTIGRDLIQDRYTAIVELVKNAYDADSPDVNIDFKASADQNRCSICIEDHGHGMSRDIVINRWMVPSTDDKLKRQKSPAGRTMQGRKGIGRYAASILGDNLLLETVTANGEKTTIYVEWQTFESARYLDDVEILIETKVTSEPAGTRLTITGGTKLLNEWGKLQLDKLKYELKKLVPPVNIAEPEVENNNKFLINLSIAGSFVDQKDIIRETIEPFPIFNLFDYKITGRVGSDGTGVLSYSSPKARNTIEEKIQLDLGSPTDCGELIFDIRVYDREKESIDSLIGRGLKDETGNYFTNLQTSMQSLRIWLTTVFIG